MSNGKDPKDSVHLTCPYEACRKGILFRYVEEYADKRWPEWNRGELECPYCHRLILLPKGSPPMTAD